MNNRVVIVEDEFFVSSHLKTILIKAGYEVIAQFHKGETVLSQIDSFKHVLFLLDIQLSSKVSGIDLAKELSARKIPFIFITANTEDKTLSSAILTQPLAFISKPFKDIDVIAGLALGFQHVRKKIKLSTSREVYYLEQNEILYLQSENIYVTVFTKSKNYTVRKQLRDFESVLSSDFKRCHRSYIINRASVTSIKKNTIYIGTIEIPISKKYKSNLEHFV